MKPRLLVLFAFMACFGLPPLCLATPRLTAVFSNHGLRFEYDPSDTLRDDTKNGYADILIKPSAGFFLYLKLFNNNVYGKSYMESFFHNSRKLFSTAGKPVPCSRSFAGQEKKGLSFSHSQYNIMERHESYFWPLQEGYLGVHIVYDEERTLPSLIGDRIALIFGGIRMTDELLDFSFYQNQSDVETNRAKRIAATEKALRLWTAQDGLTNYRDQSFSLARDCLRDSRTEDAKKIYKRLAQEFPEWKWIEYKDLSFSDQHHGRPASARSNMDKAVKMAAPSAEPYLARAQLLRLQGNSASSISNLKEALRHPLNSWNMAAWIIYDFYHWDDVTNAMMACEKSLSLFPDKTTFHHWKGILLRRMGAPAESVPVLQNALRLIAKDTDWVLPSGIRHDLALSLMKTGNPGTALEECDRGLTENPRSPYLLNARGLALFKMKKRKQALEEFRSALEKDPAFAPAYANIAVWHWTGKKRNEALSSLRQTVERDLFAFKWRDDWELPADMLANPETREILQSGIKNP